MVELILAVLKGLFPFLKESLLEGGTLREWVSKNRTTCVWLIFHAVMLFVVVYLASGLHKLNQHVIVVTGQNTALTQRVSELETINKGLSERHVQMMVDHQVVNDELTVVKAELSTYKGAAALCGVTVHQNGTFTCPRAAAPARSAPRRPAVRRAPEPEPTPVEPPKPTFGERLRSIFKPHKE